MKRERLEGRKFFLAAFALTLVVLSLIMVGTVLAVQPTLDNDRGRQTPKQEALSYRPPASDTLTLVVIGASSREDAKQFLLIRFNPQYGQIPLSVLPSQTLVELDGERMTLRTAYQKEGGQGVKAALSERLGIIVDRYAVLGGEGFVRVAAKAGSVLYTLPYDVAYDRGGFPVKLPAGERRLDGQDILDIFRYPLFEKEPAQKSELLGNLCAAVVEQNIEAAKDDAITGLFKLAVNLADTDVTSRDFELRRESAQFMANLNLQISASIPVSGTMLADGVSYELSTDYVELMKRYFQQLG